MSDLKAYSLDQVILTFANILLNEGYDENEFVSFARNKASYTLKMGADGSGTRSAVLDKSGKITVKLMHTSLVNNALQAIWERDQGAPNGAGVGLLQCRDLNSNVLLAKASTAWISEPPKPGRGAEVGTNEWTFETNKLDLDLSGNPTITGG